MSKESNMIKFLRNRSGLRVSDEEYDDEFDDFEAWEEHAELLEKQDYPARTPAFRRASILSCFFSVGMNSLSDWKPSQATTSFIPSIEAVIESNTPYL